MTTRFFSGLLVGILLTLAGTWAWSHFSGESFTTSTLNAPTILREVQGLNELVSVKYTLQKVVDLEEQKQPLGTEKILLFVQADVLAGIDLSKLTVSNVNLLPDRAIRLTLPPPQIEHLIIDDKQTKVWDRQITWWTPWVPYNQDLERQARLKAAAIIEKAALDSGILDQARRNAETSIRGLLETLGAKTVTIVPSGS